MLMCVFVFSRDVSEEIVKTKRAQVRLNVSSASQSVKNQHSIPRKSKLLRTLVEG